MKSINRRGRKLGWKEEGKKEKRERERKKWEKLYGVVKFWSWKIGVQINGEMILDQCKILVWRSWKPDLHIRRCQILFEVKGVSLFGFHFGFVVNSLYKVYWNIIFFVLKLKWKNLVLMSIIYFYAKIER